MKTLKTLYWEKTAGQSPQKEGEREAKFVRFGCEKEKQLP